MLVRFASYTPLQKTLRSIVRIVSRLAPIAVIAIAFFAFSHGAYAQQEVADSALEVGQQAGLATTDIRIFIGNIVKGFLVLLGFVAVVIMLYAGYLWMTAAGDAKQIQKSQQTMGSAAIGLFIIVSAYAITAFIFNALTGTTGFGIGGGGNGPGFTGVFQGTAGTDALGSGIIEYHFPEPNQRDIPRNAKISITFKQPLVLSTVFRGYDDKGTYATNDDVIPAVLELNTDNVRILAEEQLGTGGSGSADEQFVNRYPENVILGNPAPLVQITEVPTAFDPLVRQTIVISPRQLLGSATSDVSYRVGLRGGANGVKVWDVRAGSTTPVAEVAFGRALADGGYHWSFTTNTLVDRTAPQISAVVPTTTPNPQSSIMPRNQLVQMYFTEAVDPTRVSGEVTAAGGGNVQLRLEARCRAGVATEACDARYRGTDFVAVPGSYVIGNKYRTVEFTPSAPCENVTENSCGEKVFCLPKNVDLQVRAISAAVGTEPPASVGSAGITDMVGNSLDGNRDEKSQGPVSTEFPQMFLLNTPQPSLDGVSDTAVALFAVGDTVDLVPPVVIDIDPRSASPKGNPDISTLYADGGPSGFPPTKPLTVGWSKVISLTSLRTGKADDERATLVFDSSECVKNGTASCDEEPCTCTNVDAPWFLVDMGNPVELQGGGEGTRFQVLHRPFFTANDLGYTEADILAFPQGTPRYVPQLRAKIKDVRQNCFYPSVGFECSADADLPSCCDREGQADFSCPPSP